MFKFPEEDRSPVGVMIKLTSEGKTGIFADLVDFVTSAGKPLRNYTFVDNEIIKIKDVDVFKKGVL